MLLDSLDQFRPNKESSTSYYILLGSVGLMAALLIYDLQISKILSNKGFATLPLIISIILSLGIETSDKNIKKAFSSVGNNLAKIFFLMVFIIGILVAALFFLFIIWVLYIIWLL